MINSVLLKFMNLTFFGIKHFKDHVSSVDFI